MSVGLLVLAPAALASGSDVGPEPSACTNPPQIGKTCTRNTGDGVVTFTPNVVKVGEKIVASMAVPSGAGDVWTWPNLRGLTPQACAPSAPTCTYVANAETGTPGGRYIIGIINGSSAQDAWYSAQAYAVDSGGPDALPTFAPAQANGVDSGGSGGSGATGGTAAGRPLDVRGLWDGYYIAVAGGARYHNPVVFLTEDFSTGRLTGTDNGTDGPSSVAGYISGRTIHATITQPPSYSADATWVLSADGSKLVSGNITDPNATHAFVLYRHGPPVGAIAVTSGAGVTSGPAPITALPTPGQAFSSPARVAAGAAIAVAAVLLITFPANLFNKTFEENYDVIAAWWEPKLRRFRRKPQTDSADKNAEADVDQARRERNRFGLVVVAGAVLGGLLNPKFGANSASVNSFVATLLAVLAGTAISTGVGLIYRKHKHYDVTRRFEALPAGLAIGALCVVLSRVSDFQPGYLYGIVCGVAFAGALAKNENAHLIALGHLATIGVAVLAWVLWVPVNHAAVQHAGVFPLVILDDLLASLFVGGLVGSVISLIPVRFMPGHALASWHRGVWMAVFGLAAFGLTEIVLFPSQHNHAGHAPLITIIVLFVFFGGGSLVFRDYFARRAKRLEGVAGPLATASSGEQA